MLDFYFDINETLCVNDAHKHLRCHLSELDEDILASTELMILKNIKRFERQEYEKIPIVPESIMSFYYFPTTRIQRTFFVERGTLTHDDSLLMAITGITEDEDDFFTIREAGFHTRTD